MERNWNKNKICFLIFCGFFCFFSFSQIVKADYIGETKTFSLDPLFDSDHRTESEAVLVFSSDKLYFYIDKGWWEDQTQDNKNRAVSGISSLSSEFQNNIYPKLTKVYGTERNPGIDNDSRTTILFHPLRKGNGGYFNSGNEYSKLMVPASNQREMIYVNAEYLASPILKRLVAHEFTHLISFNQKEQAFDIEEDIWLNELRAEYASTICGYDSPYQDSNLEKRAKEFLNNPSDSLTNWQGMTSDYAVINLFAQYLVDQYGQNILIDSMKANKKGIESIDYALSKNGYSDTFSNVFTNWTIAVYVNDCSLGSRYCYKTESLKSLKVLPLSSFLVPDSKGFLSVRHNTEKWSGNWYKIFGTGEVLDFQFSGDVNSAFKMPYVLCDKKDVCQIQSLILDNTQAGKITVNNFAKDYSYIVIIPSAQTAIGGVIPFQWTAKGSSAIIDEEDPELIKSLLAQIEVLKAQIAALLAQKSGTSAACQISSNLYYGVANVNEVKCLQEFLKKQGGDIYPEGIISGNFFGATKGAVIRFQEKYASEILAPSGLSRGTGYVGEATRKKISQLNK